MNIKILIIKIYAVKNYPVKIVNSLFFSLAFMLIENLVQFPKEV